MSDETDPFEREDFAVTEGRKRDLDEWFDPSAQDAVTLSLLREITDRLDRLIAAQERTNRLLERMGAQAPEEKAPIAGRPPSGPYPG